MDSPLPRSVLGGSWIYTIALPIVAAGCSAATAHEASVEDLSPWSDAGPDAASTADWVPSATGGAFSRAARPSSPIKQPTQPAQPPDAGQAAPLNAQPLAWQPCGEDASECATLEVPIDYAEPNAGQMQLAVTRRRAVGERTGVLAVNFGGPGIAGGMLLDGWVDYVARDLNQRFDIVTVDPRGVAASKPIIDCRDVASDAVVMELPANATDWAALEKSVEAYARGCAAKNTALLSHVGTWDHARDLDVLRERLGEDSLSYYGVSYGTALGSRYAELFPARVRAMVLDSSMNDGLDRVELSLQEGAASELALGRYFAWCDEASERCSTWTRGRSAVATFKQIDVLVHAGELRLSSAETLGTYAFYQRIRRALLGGMPAWDALTRAFAAAATRDAAAFIEALTPSTQAPSRMEYDNSSEAGLATDCFDMPVASPADVYAQLERYRFDLPHFGLPRAIDVLLCAYWPAKDLTNAQRIPHAVGAPPIVVIGSSGDPATPFAWSVAQAMHFDQSVLLIRQGEGHGAFGAGSSCIDGAVNGYLVDLVKPTDRTICTDAPVTSPFPISRPQMMP